MLSPTPFSLLCAVLLCLPLAIIFTITTPLIPSSTIYSGGPTVSSTTSRGGSTVSSTKTLTLTRNKTKISPIPTLPSYTKTLQKPKNGTKTTTTAIRPSPQPQPLPPPRMVPTHLRELDDDDDSLFELASRDNSNPRPPKKKLAFMFLTTSPLPLAPLWEAFFNHTPKNLYNIYIHADPSYNYTPPFRGVFTHRVIPSILTHRNTPTLASAARKLLANALLHDKSNYVFALLSPTCIPLHSFNFTYGILSQSKKSFLEILDSEPGAFDRWVARGEQAMLPGVKFEDFRIGSQFFVLTRKHARIVVRDRRVWSKFKLPCLKLDTCYPEEQYFPTLLNMVDPHGCVAATLTHVDWSGSFNGHRRMYDADEVSPELIWALKEAIPRYGNQKINGSHSSVTKRPDPFLFARKFSPECIQPLMSIANDVIFKD